MSPSFLKIVRILSLMALLLSFVVVALGAYTRLKDAGLGCPDWPGCYGHLSVPTADLAMIHSPEADFHAGKAWKEMIHRYAAGSLGILILILFSLALYTRSTLRLHRIASLLLLTVLFQALLGMYTVTLKLHPLIVTGHLIGGFATLGLVIAFTQRVWMTQPDPLQSLRNSIKYRRAVVFGLFVLIIQIVLGGWTSTNYAALACPDFPTCLGRWVIPVDPALIFGIPLDPSINFEGGVLAAELRASIHWLHRLGAFVVLCVLSGILIPLSRKVEGSIIPLLSRLGLIVLLIQVLLGVSNVIFGLPLFVAVAHNLNAALLMSVLIAILVRLSLHSTPNLVHKPIL